MNRHRLALMLVAALAMVVPRAAAAADASRQHDVERKSEQVMPFAMGATLHRFVPGPRGGMQIVTVRNGDARQIQLVRAHLRKEAKAFARGDFADPAAIHGGTMPGLATLHAHARAVRVAYADIPNGGRITYTSDDPALIAAIHSWFKAQVSDHGDHATMHM